MTNEQKSLDSKAGDSKAGDSKAGDSKAGDSKAGDGKAGLRRKKFNNNNGFGIWLMITLRYLGSRRYERVVSINTIIAIVGITLGVSTLIIVLSVMNGLRQELLKRIVGLDGHIIVQPLAQMPQPSLSSGQAEQETDSLDNYDRLAADITSLDGVRYAFPVIEGQVLATGRYNPAGAFVRGVSANGLKHISPIAVTGVKNGSIDNFDKNNELVVGSSLAANLGVGIGDKIKLLTPNGTVTPFGVTPKQKSYSLAATFNIGMESYDNLFIFMPITLAKQYFGTSMSQVILVYVNNPDNIDQTKVAIREVTDNANVDAFITDWRQRNVTFFSALEVERDAMFFILTMIVLVAVFNIITAITMLVNTKAKEIAILRTMGASRGLIVRIFIGFGTGLGCVGVLLGGLAGIIISLNIEAIRQFVSTVFRTQVFSPEIYSLSTLPAHISISEVLVIIGVTMLLSFAASFYPAWRAGHVSPVEGLRYE